MAPASRLTLFHVKHSGLGSLGRQYWPSLRCLGIRSCGLHCDQLPGAQRDPKRSKANVSFRCLSDVFQISFRSRGALQTHGDEVPQAGCAWERAELRVFSLDQHLRSGQRSPAGHVDEGLEQPPHHHRSFGTRVVSKRATARYHFWRPLLNLK